MNGEFIDSHLLSHYNTEQYPRHLLILKYNYSVLVCHTLVHNIIIYTIYMVLRFLLDTLSTFLDPFLDGLLGHDPCSVEGGIKANVLVFDDPGAWLL